MSPAARTRAGGGRVVLIGIALVAVLLVVGALTADRRTGRPFDPASSEPDGVKAMVDLLSGFGARVGVPDRLPSDDVDAAVIFLDESDRDERDRLLDWVRDGHVLVVADPASALVPEADFAPGSFANPTSSAVRRGDCPVEALDEVDEIDPGDDSRYRYVDDPDVPMCFLYDDEGAFLTAQAEGDGAIIGLASGDLFTNERLGDADNAALAVSLLAPRPGYRVDLLGDAAFVSAGDGGADGVSLTGLIGPGVRLLFLELLVALVVLALASGRRLGRPISEPQPVQIAGSELVEAVGQLLQQRRDPAAAAAVLRADLHRLVVQRFGIAPDASPAVTAEAVAGRTALERDYVLAVLSDQQVATDTELAALAAHIDRIREEVLHGHAP